MRKDQHTEALAGRSTPALAVPQQRPGYRGFWLVLALLLMPGSRALGGEVLLTASGTISTVSDGLESGFSIGQRVTYQLVYDSASPSSHARTSFNIFMEAIGSLSVSVGGFAALSPAGEIRVANGITDAGDVFIAEASFADGLTGPAIGRFPLTRISFQLWDTEAGAWDSKALPAAFPEITQFDNRVFSMDFVDSNNTYIVTGLLDSLSAVSISAVDGASSD